MAPPKKFVVTQEAFEAMQTQLEASQKAISDLMAQNASGAQRLIQTQQSKTFRRSREDVKEFVEKPSTCWYAGHWRFHVQVIGPLYRNDNMTGARVLDTRAVLIEFTRYAGPGCELKDPKNEKKPLWEFGQVDLANLDAVRDLPEEMRNEKIREIHGALLSHPWTKSDPQLMWPHIVQAALVKAQYARLDMMDDHEAQIAAIRNEMEAIDAEKLGGKETATEPELATA